MNWSQILEILNGLAQPVLVFFTVGLVIATVLLYLSTRRYAKATEELVRIEQLDFVDRLQKRVHPGNVPRSEAYRQAVMGIDRGERGQTVAEKEGEFNEKWCRVYGGLAKKILDGMDKELNRGDTE